MVERYPERLGAPKAHALSPRSLEICRQSGLDVRELRHLGTPREDAYWVNFVTNLAGEAVGRLPYERMDAGVLDHTPEMIHNIPQPVFEQFLTEHLVKDPNVEIRKGVSFVSLKEMNGVVTTTVEERGTSQKYQIVSDFVIGCDGAKSRVRSSLGIESDGEDSYETMMTIHFNADIRPVIQKRVGMLHWIIEPLSAGFIIGYDLSDNLVLISNFDADIHPVETWNETLCNDVVKSAIGQEIPFQILSYRPWLLSRKVAKSYRIGHVFLAGDAAHSFPPTGGLGLNSGIADVHNLAHKIALVLYGQASDTILDTYQHDRRHVAEINSRQSVKNGKKVFDLLKTMGTAGMTDLEQARKNLYATIHDPARQPEIQAGIEEQREHFDNVNLYQFRVSRFANKNKLELHIGYVYGSTEIPPHASVYTPRFVPGARVPHAWIKINDPAVVRKIPRVDLAYVRELSDTDRAQREYSTLDLCHDDAFTFVLNSTSTLTEQILQQVDKMRRNGLKIEILQLGRDFDVSTGSSGQDWISGAGLATGGGLLVRPDQHILLRMSEGYSIEYIHDTLNGYLFGQNRE